MRTTGCELPCRYRQYRLAHTIPGFYSSYGLGIAYSSTVLRVEEEDWVCNAALLSCTEHSAQVYTWPSFLAEFGGALGMFLGFSFIQFWDLLTCLQARQ